jgi:hypothetical protein
MMTAVAYLLDRRLRKSLAAADRDARSGSGSRERSQSS